MKTFKLDLKEEEVQIGNDNYVVREFDGGARDSYMEDLTARVVEEEVKGERKSVVKRVAGLQVHLLSLCLFPKGRNIPVEKAVISKWPATVIDELAKIASSINQLDKKPEVQEKEAKNVSGASVGSGTSSP